MQFISIGVQNGNCDIVLALLGIQAILNFILRGRNHYILIIFCNIVALGVAFGVSTNLSAPIRRSYSSDFSQKAGLANAPTDFRRVKTEVLHGEQAPEL